jgi:hypothetical protein
MMYDDSTTQKGRKRSKNDTDISISKNYPFCICLVDMLLSLKCDIHNESSDTRYIMDACNSVQLKLEVTFHLKLFQFKYYFELFLVLIFQVIKLLLNVVIRYKSFGAACIFGVDLSHHIERTCSAKGESSLIVVCDIVVYATICFLIINIHVNLLYLYRNDSKCETKYSSTGR